MFCETITDDFGHEISIIRRPNGDCAVTAYGAAVILKGDAAERVATYMRDKPDACEEALRQQVVEELCDAGELVYNEEEGQLQTQAVFDQWAKDCADEFEHRRQESRQDLFI